MSSKQPVLGSAALQLPAQKVLVSPSTCQNLSLFKELMKEYRKLDDSITMRMNRNNASFRDRDRLSGSSSSRAQGNSLQDEACAYFWRELVATWRGRAEIIDYCVKVVDQRMDDTRAALRDKDPADISPEAARDRRRKEALLFSDEVQRSQIHYELSVEKIVRRRSVEAFQTRCRFFQPPLSDQEARQWWDKTQSENSPKRE